MLLRRRRLVLVILLLYLVGPAACITPLTPSVSSGVPESPINRLERGLMDATDLPSGWSRRSTGVPNETMGSLTARYRDYQGPQREAMIFVRVGQTIYLYRNEAESDAAYKSTLAELIPAAYSDQWPWPPELDIRTHADELVIGCNPLVINDVSATTCRVLARYGDLVTVVRGQVFPDRWLTMAQFRHLLERVDMRMESIR